MLVELRLVEQRHKAVLEVLAGATITDVATRNGVTRQTVHRWLRRYAYLGLPGLADHSSRPASCPHQMSAETEVRILELREEHPGWGPRSLGHQLQKEDVFPLPGRSSIYRVLIRHGLVDPQKRKRKRTSTVCGVRAQHGRGPTRSDPRGKWPFSPAGAFSRFPGLLP